MTSAASTVVPLANSTATFNAWGQAVSNILTAGGVTLVGGVTGAVSWPVGSAPTAGTAPHFEIRKLDDPETGAPAVYMRFEYGRNNSTGPLLRIVVGTGVNTGTGVLTGPGSAVAAANILPQTANAGDSGTRTMWCACDGDGMILMHALESTNHRAVLVVDRQRRADGVAAPNSGWPDIGFSRLINNNNHLHVDPVTGLTFATIRIPSITNRTFFTSTSMQNGSGDTTVFPLFLSNPQGLYNSKMMVTMTQVDGPASSFITVDHLDATRTYRCAGNYFNGYDGVLNAGATFAMWWSD